MADTKGSLLKSAKQAHSYVKPIRRAWKIYGIVVTILNLGFVGWLRHYDQTSHVARIALWQSPSVPRSSEAGFDPGSLS
jgi:hypothetical protein